MLSAGAAWTYRDRLLLCRGASGFAQVTHTRCLTGASISCLVAGCLLNEGARESSSRQATPPKYDEGTLATNYTAATGERIP